MLGTNHTKMAAGRLMGYLQSLIPSLLLTKRTEISACKPMRITHHFWERSHLSTDAQK